MATEKGLASVNIRNIARACNVSVGSIYYYYPSKTELISATIGEIWKDIFHTGDQDMPHQSFPDYVAWIFTNVRNGLAKYPNFFFAHSMSFASDEKERGRSMMEQYFSHIKKGLLETLQNDNRVNPHAFTETFTRPDFVDFVFMNLLALFARQAESCFVLNEMIRRTIYEM